MLGYSAASIKDLMRHSIKDGRWCACVCVVAVRESCVYMNVLGLNATWLKQREGL